MIVNGRKFEIDENCNIVKTADDYEPRKKKRSWGQFLGRAGGALAGGAAGAIGGVMGADNLVTQDVVDPAGAQAVAAGQRALESTEQSYALAQRLKQNHVMAALKKLHNKQTDAQYAARLTRDRATEPARNLAKGIAGVVGGLGGALGGGYLGSKITG
jgi:dihydrodipicolinate synthase/N-acetylneuraminate lyase